MATGAGRQLTHAHRLAQIRLAGLTIVQLRAIFKLLDPKAVDATFDQWLLAAMPIIDGQRDASSRLAAAYVQEFKELEVGRTAAPITLAGRASRRALTTSLMVTGPIAIKLATKRGLPIERAADLAEGRAAAAGMRYVLDAGRETIAAMVKRDDDARGFERVASAGACQFCAGLAGATFMEGDVFQAHDGCSCTAEPVYR